jgi:hypothetical protein
MIDSCYWRDYIFDIRKFSKKNNIDFIIKMNPDYRNILKIFISQIFNIHKDIKFYI